MPSAAAASVDGMPHGTVVGTASNGVTAYNCNYEHLLPAADGEPYDHLNYVRDSRGKLQYSGDKWQCVEYARRTWISQLDIYLPNTPRACDIWERKFVKRLGDGARVSLAMYTSGVTMHCPAVNDLVIWKATETQPFGHVAVVSEVTEEFVRIAEQNAHNDRPWIGGHWARQFSLTRDAQSGAWIMHDAEDPLFGWVRADLGDVAPALPWNPPDEDITSVDGQYGEGSAKCVQKFVGVRADGDHGRMTDMALAAFLNTHHHSYPHVPMPVYGSSEYDRAPLIRKLQNFLLAHADMTAAVEHKVVENGEFDEPTVQALQQLLNHVNLGDEFEAAAIVYENGGPPPRPNLPHGTVLGVAPCGVVGYNCNYNNFPELPDGEVFDMQTYVKDSLGRFTYSGMKWQVLL